MFNRTTRPATESLDLIAGECPDPYVRAVTGLGLRRTAPAIDAGAAGLPIAAVSKQAVQNCAKA